MENGEATGRCPQHEFLQCILRCTGLARLSVGPWPFTRGDSSLGASNRQAIGARPWTFSAPRLWVHLGSWLLALGFLGSGLCAVFSIKKQTSLVNRPYFAIGETYDILDPGTPQRAHQGNAQNQNGTTPTCNNSQKTLASISQVGTPRRST